MQAPKCNKCEKRAHWRQPVYQGGGNVNIVRACDDHAAGSGWLRAYPSPSPSPKTRRLFA